MSKRKRGRPRKPPVLCVFIRVDPELLLRIDAWRARQLKNFPKIPSRPEAMRRLVQLALL